MRGSSYPNVGSLLTAAFSHIDLLKLRSFAVHCRFPDADVLKPDFAQKLADVARVVRPFVHRSVSCVHAGDMSLVLNPSRQAQ